jgi:hypothetical protein
MAAVFLDANLSTRVTRVEATSNQTAVALIQALATSPSDGHENT